MPFSGGQDLSCHTSAPSPLFMLSFNHCGIPIKHQEGQHVCVLKKSKLGNLRGRKESPFPPTAQIHNSLNLTVPLHTSPEWHTYTHSPPKIKVLQAFHLRFKLGQSQNPDPGCVKWREREEIFAPVRSVLLVNQGHFGKK